MKQANIPNPLSRRDFLKLASIGLGGLAVRPFDRWLSLVDFPVSERLGRNCTGGKVPIKAAPDYNSATIREIYEDTVLAWLRELPASNPDYNRNIQRWVETPEGYIYSPNLQPCQYHPNTPLSALPPDRPEGFWAEVTVPYVDLLQDNPPPRSPGVKYQVENGLPVRYYYSQVLWVDQVRAGDSGGILYRLNEGEKHGYGYGDIFWADGAAFRPLTDEEVAPLSPEVDPAEKVIKINLTYQTLACYEGGREVYFCRISTGLPDYETPVGEHITWRKTFSVHMAAGTVDAGYDTPGVSWATFVAGTGVAIHAAFWHNLFGLRRSHGCINCRPEDAKWIFRWSTPFVSLVESDVTWSDWKAGSTHVIVEERLY
ncbi:MAG: L,D-transpeptidase [Chloroflexi bacterium]|nr:L,D-transpeptidase [Chloroflexota bacterium]